VVWLRGHMNSAPTTDNHRPAEIICSDLINMRQFIQ
jgi:hypothetical protein